VKMLWTQKPDSEHTCITPMCSIEEQCMPQLRIHV
jgi:hypothetical protein